MASYPNIPDRSSSLNQWNSKQLQIKQSQDNLKRKLSSISVEDSPIEYQKVRLQQLEADEDEQRHLKQWCELEHQARHLTDSQHKKAQKEANVRLVSLGEDMWKERRKLRMLEEAANELPALGPDTEGAFTAVLMRLYKDPFEHAKRLSSLQTEMKDAAIAGYETFKGAPKSGRHWCPITQAYHDKSLITAGHIIPHSLGPEVVDYICGPGAGSRLNSADNCLLMESKVEKHFNKGHFVLLPVDPTESPIKQWKVQVTNDSALDSQVGNHGEELRDYQGRILVWQNEERPAARFLYYHFVVTSLRNSHYKTLNYAHYSATLATGKPFATMGPYLRKSVLLALARKAGDVDEVAEAMIEAAGQSIKDDDKEPKLSEKEGEEIARRMLEKAEVAEEVEDVEDY